MTTGLDIFNQMSAADQARVKASGIDLSKNVVNQQNADGTFWAIGGWAYVWSTTPVIKQDGLPEAPTPSSSSPAVATPGAASSTIKTPDLKFPVFSDVYGDVSKTPTVPNNANGLWTSTGQKITDLNAIDTSKINPDSYKYGKDAEAQEAATGGYTSPRNDMLAAYYLKKGITDEKGILAELQKNPSFLTSSGAEGDQLNTARAISARIGLFQGQQQGTQFPEIEAKYASDKEALLKAGAIEDRYTNFNDVDKEVQGVLKAGGEDRLAKWYDGMPTDKDIQEIAAKSWVSFDRAKRIMEGFGYESLQMQPEYAKEVDRGYNRLTDELTTKQQRDQADLDTKLAQTKQDIQWQQQDVMKTAERSIASASMVGALRGQTMTSGFVQGVQQIQTDTNETVARLETMLSRAQSLTGEQKARALDDYNTALKTAKEDLDYTHRDLNQQMGTAYNSILQSYGGTQLAAKLKELNSSMVDAKIEQVNKYVDTIAKINKDQRDQMDQIQKQQESVTKAQDTTWKQLTDEKGKYLARLSKGDLYEMYKNNHISADQFKMAVGSQVAKTVATLGQMGTPNTADVEMIKQLLDKGSTPHAALQKVAAASNGRLVLTWKEATTANAIENWYATASTRKSYLKKTGGNKDQFATNFLKANAPDGDPDSIGRAMELMSNAWLEPDNTLNVFLNAYGKEKTAQNVATSYKGDIDSASTTAKKDEARNEMIWSLKKIYGKTFNDDDVYIILDKAGFGSRDRWNIVKSLKQ